jgi:Flp pilus assembly protein TadD
MGMPCSGTSSIDRRSRVLLTGLLLAAVTIALYWPVQGFDFIAFDDTAYVTENRIVQEGLTMNGARWAFSAFEVANWHPLTWLSHMFDVELYGLHAGRHHWTSVCIHAAATLALFAALQIMTGAIGASALTAALFAVHPLHVESVAWVAERKDVLSGLFWFLCLAAYAFYAKKPSAGRYVAVLLSLALGLMSKPMAVTLPFVLLLLDYWPLGRFGSAVTVFDGSFGGVPSAGAASVKRLVVEKTPLIALVAASCAITLMAQGGGGAVIALDQIPLEVRIANAFVSYVEYLWNTAWPAGLAMFYPHFGMPPAWKISGSVLLLAALTGLAVRGARRYPYLQVGWLWYLGTLVPVIGIVQVGSQSMADRYTYIPLVGIFIAGAWGLRDLAGKSAILKKGVVALAAVALVGLTVTARAQIGTWADSKTLFTHALRVIEANPVVHNNLGVIFLNEGDGERAAAHLRRALELRPRYADALFNFGLCAFKAGDRGEAARLFGQTLREDPGADKAHVYLGFILLEQGRPGEASGHFREALRIRPDQEAAHHHLAVALMQLNEYASAERHLRETVRLSPRNPEAYNNLGVVLMAQARYGEAIEALKAAESLAPGRPIVGANLRKAQAGSL